MGVFVKDAQINHQQQQHKAGESQIKPPVFGKWEKRDVHGLRCFL
jgi:hypothetical protein